MTRCCYRLDLNGRHFARWTVLGPVNVRGTKRYWLCRCKCGTERYVKSDSLTSGKSQSCGCLNREHVRAAMITHGQYRSSEYHSWQMAKRRSHSPSYFDYHRWGGRGIVMCLEWRDSFETFIADMGPKPDPEYSLDRIDNNGPYSKANCRWSSRAVQNRNNRRNHYIEFEGRSMVITDWAATVGLNLSTLNGRLRRGWSVKRALTEPIQHKGRWFTSHAST